MKPSSKLALRYALLAGVIACVTGCIVVKFSVNSPKQQYEYDSTHNGKQPTKASDWEDSPIPPPPTGNAGALYVQTTSFSGGNGAQDCFPAPQGWDRYYPLPKFFLGPGVNPNATSYTNIDQLPKVTVQTCNPTNGTTMETGVVIYEQFHSLTDKRCATNIPVCGYGAKLTINQRDIAPNKKYIAVVFYKSSTIGTNTSVVVDWSYP